MVAGIGATKTSDAGWTNAGRQNASRNGGGRTNARSTKTRCPNAHQARRSGSNRSRPSEAGTVSALTAVVVYVFFVIEARFAAFVGLSGRHLTAFRLKPATAANTTAAAMAIPNARIRFL